MPPAGAPADRDPPLGSAASCRSPTGSAAPLLFLLGVFLLGLSAAPLPAQSVRGTVSDAETGEPVAGAFVSLRSAPTGDRVDGALSSEGGHYALSAPGPGRYRIRVERIGYETWTSEPVEVSVGETLTRALEIGVRAVELEELQVSVTGGCQSDPSEASAVGRLWQEVRKALEPAAWAEREGRYRFTIVRYRRTLEPASGRVREFHTTPEEQVEGRPFRALPVERLVEGGFRQVEDDTTYYYAPDAEVLASNAFAADHCFELASEEEAPAPGLVGLSFRPTEWWGSVTVRGTFWLSTDPVRLQELRFSYAGLSRDLPEGRLGGRIRYRRLPDGGWIVEDWRIRMPRTATQHIMMRGFRGDRTRTVLTSIVENGGRVVRAVGPEGEARYAEGTATIQGTVTDSLGGGGSREGLQISVAGTEVWAMTDSTGMFRLPGVPAGTHRIEVSAPELELAGLAPPSTELVVREDGSYFVELATPSPRTVLERACGSETTGSRTEGSVLLVGRVTDPEGVAVPDARVTATWTRQSIMVRAEGEAAVSRTPTRRVARPGPEGTYRLCGLPGETGLSLEAEAEREEGTLRGEASLQLPPEGLARKDLVVGTGR